MIRAGAPGKVVLWGEYAVLAGAPAMVMAVDRYALCTLEPGGRSWRFTAPGFSERTAILSREHLVAATPPPADAIWNLVWHVLQTIDGARLPAGATVCLDTRTFQEQGLKLGIGSSAALCAAVYAAFARLLGAPARYATALDAHWRFQGGAGSGIDVAAAWHGGTLRVQRCSSAHSPLGVQPSPLPEALRPCFVFAGESASTPRHLERFQQWRHRAGHDELDALGAASAALFDAREPIAAMASYVEALEALDRAAGLGIFSDAHRRLQRLANDAGVVYKPCGAGGGDVGAAFTPDTAAAERFVRLAADNGFLPLALETASHGIEVTG